MDDLRGLVGRAQAGEAAAFDELAERCRPDLEGVVRARLGPELRGRLTVDDVLQETFARALGSLRDFEWRGDGSVRGWIRAIAVNVIREAARREKRKSTIALDFDLPDEDPSPGKRLEREERFERFEKAFRSLSPDYRRVLWLVRIEGVPIGDVARRMKRSPNAVSHLLLRALRSLREAFGETESYRLGERSLEADAMREEGGTDA